LWRSGPSPAFELKDPRWRRHLYEIVLAQGTAHDVERYVDPELLVADWDHLWLPPAVHAAWDGWIEQHRAELVHGA